MFILVLHMLLNAPDSSNPALPAVNGDALTWCEGDRLVLLQPQHLAPSTFGHTRRVKSCEVYRRLWN